MIQFDSNGNASLYPHKVNYTHGDETVEKWALPSKEWWTELQAKWPNEVTIHNFIDVELTPEQIQRFESVQPHIVDGYGFAEYIETGEFPRGIIGIPEEIQSQIQAKQEEIQAEENEERKEELRKEMQEMIPRPSLQEMLDFVSENFNK